MVSAVDAVGLAVIVLANTAIAALLTRFFRVRLQTKWGGPVFAVLLGSLTLVISTLVLGGFLQLGPNLQSHGTVIGITIVAPLAVGLTFDYFWMPAPAEIDLPERDEQRPPESR
ncbi:hypothetical protein Hrd1104_13010 [Halorhabdus sp. CBA1104]|uniref:hypothetical protein n=1 Tax=unclassified Halorhabdus TaxID=2621901 RepID=UPI0012B31239|nr:MULTISPECIES: hypothetical protein [unclassified Halorhabdus]QGN08124.1 hypothetical protein Hrd1104_13010 [Halorhabdus sp. CBA1104]